MADKDGRNPTHDGETIQRNKRDWDYSEKRDKAQVPYDEYKQPLEPWPEKPKK